MQNRELAEAFAELSSPLVADAGLRLGLALGLAPAGILPVVPRTKAAGRVLPARHTGSVDVFLEAIAGSDAGDLLVIDNGARDDEGCIGDLTVLEARAAGLAGVLVWGFHRDTRELLEIGFPVFTYGRCPSGPRRLDPRPAEGLTSARFGDGVEVGAEWIGFADDDGAVFAPAASIRELLDVALEIARRERHQAALVRSGTTLREQFQFDEYLRRRAARPEHTLRRHLRELGGAIEE